VLVHIALRDGLFWIEADQTPEGFALDLEAEGIPKERIVLKHIVCRTMHKQPEHEAPSSDYQ
jgi:hypothetical protein